MREYAYFAGAGLKTRLLNRLRRALMWPPAERLLLRFARGRSTTSLPARMIPMEYLYPRGSWRQVERHGSKLRLDLSNGSDHGAYFDLADPGADAFQRMLKRTDTVVDIGANIGIRTLAFAQAVPEGRVVSFEPHPVTFGRLMEHISMNQCTNVLALNVGIGETRSTERLFEVVGTNSGMNRILPHTSENERFHSAEITIAPLSTMLEEHGIGRVNAIKIDVEGYEMHALRGCLPVLVRDRPILFIELDDDNLLENGSSARALIRWIEDLDYAVSRAEDRTPVPADLSHCHFDIICTPRTRP